MAVIEGGRRSRFELRISPADRADLRALADEVGQDQSKVVRDLIRDAIAAKRAQQIERYGLRLFGTDEESPDEVA